MESKAIKSEEKSSNESGTWDMVNGLDSGF